MMENTDYRIKSARYAMRTFLARIRSPYKDDFSRCLIFIPNSFAVSNMGFFKPSPRFAAFSISVISLAPFVTSHAALFSRFANIGSGLYFLPISSESFTRS